MSKPLILLIRGHIWPKEDGDRLKKYYKDVLNVISPIKGMRWQWGISAILSLFLSIPIRMSAETVAIAGETFGIINDIFIAFIAMEVGAYALFQALLSEQLIWELYRNGNLLDEANTSFLGVILLFWAAIMLNIILIILFKVIPEDFLLFKDMKTNVCIAVVLLWFYFLVSLRVLFEVRNFAINLYKVFVLYNKIVILEKQKRE